MALEGLYADSDYAKVSKLDGVLSTDRRATGAVASRLCPAHTAQGGSAEDRQPGGVPKEKR